LLIYLVLVVGAVLRCIVYLQNRSFIIDESNLARNIVEKDFIGFFQPLDYEQFSPPLFSVANKVMTLIFGIHEYSLTFISLLAGIGALVLLCKLLDHLKINKVIVVYSLLLFSFSELAIRYSTEFKQYALDAFLVLIFLNWVIQKKMKDIDFKYTVKLALLGGLAIWFSMPIVFFLAGIGIYYLVLFIKEKSIKFSYLLVIGSIWLLNFGFYFFTILKTDASSDYLQNLHRGYFFNFLPTDLESAKQSFELLLDLFRSVTDKTAISLVLTMLFFLIGVYHLVRYQKKVAILLLMPVLFCLISSHLGLYSLLTRLTLFMIPIFVVVFAFGFSYARSKSNLVFKVILCAFMVLTVINKKGYQYYWYNMEFEDAKTAMEYIEENRELDEEIYVYHSGVPSFVFYNEMIVNAKLFDNYHFANWDDTPGKLFSKKGILKKGDAFWLYFTHTKPESQLTNSFESLLGKAKKIDEHRGEQSIVMKYVWE